MDNNILIKEKLFNNIKQYCILNNIDINEYINDLLLKSFNEDKYGSKPPFFFKKENDNQKNNEKNCIFEEEKNTQKTEPIKEESEIVQDSVVDEEIKPNSKRKRKLS